MMPQLPFVQQKTFLSYLPQPVSRCAPLPKLPALRWRGRDVAWVTLLGVLPGLSAYPVL